MIKIRYDMQLCDEQFYPISNGSLSLVLANIILLMLLDSFVFVNSKVVLSGCNNDYVINCRLI